MIIQSDFLTEGLFGQVFVWMLEVLPHVDAQKWRPEWRIRTKNYGQAPDFNIFPGIIRANYEPTKNGETVSFELLQRRKGVNFRYDFQAAGKQWNAHFRWTDDVVQRCDEFWRSNLKGRTVLGLHYRGTDKNVDTYQTNPVTMYQYLCVVEDFLQSNPDVDSIFVASDDHNFVSAMQSFPNVVFYDQARSKDNKPLWNQHDDSQNQAVAKEAILDCLTLSRCRYGLKCMSQLSAFSKVLNPELEIYRISACKPGWFPEAYVPLYRSENPAVQSLLSVLQRDDFQDSMLARATGIHRRTARIARQVWKRRDQWRQKAADVRFGK